MARLRKLDSEVTPAALRMREYRENRDKKRAQYINKRANTKLRLEALQHYSGDIPVCRCCGETKFEFLHLDHGFGDGAEHRRKLEKELGYHGGFYGWLKKNNWPDNLGLQVLCSNCDFGKKDNDYCPHELKRGTDINGNSIPPKFFDCIIEDISRKARTKLPMGETRQEYQKRWKLENYDRFKAVQQHAYTDLKLKCLQKYSGLDTRNVGVATKT